VYAVGQRHSALRLEYPAGLCFESRFAVLQPTDGALRPLSVTFFALPDSAVRAGLALALSRREMQPVVKGMVQVRSITYRIVRVHAGQYEVVRVLDDVRVGKFSLGARGEAIIEGDAPDVIREVARTALQGGRTTWAPRRLLA